MEVLLGTKIFEHLSWLLRSTPPKITMLVKDKFQEWKDNVCITACDWTMNPSESYCNAVIHKFVYH